jgi:capsular polysaccharide biosynthesis protein
MNRPFDAVDFVLYLRSRWRVAVIACVTALTIAGTAAMLMPRRYTATAMLIIQPPASSDPRAALAVSPVYLESLKTYLNFATGDTLFLRALDELGLRRRYPETSVESLKRHVLSVTKPAATRLIEIQATLDEPREAEHLARFIAEQTVAMNRSLDEHSGDAAVKQAEDNVSHAEARLQIAMKAAASNDAPSLDALSADVKNTSQLKYDVDRELAQARTDLADLRAQAGSFPAGDEKAAWNAREIAATLARTQDLDLQRKHFETLIAEKAAALERAKPVRDSLEAEQKLARTDLEASRARLSEVRASMAYRGERLEVLDPGIVPERPSSPNVPLILISALGLALIASGAYLAAAFGYSRAVAARAEHVYHLR